MSRWRLYRDADIKTAALNLQLPVSLLRNRINDITVSVDYHGVENPRGVLGAYLPPGGASTAAGFNLWKIQGNAGGSENIDPVHGPMNEGGLYAERLGWFLPGFDVPGKEFEGSIPFQGLKQSGVQFLYYQI
ncbi:hypothetical protein ACMFMG_003110 [Clarireedia jacksonii]